MKFSAVKLLTLLLVFVSLVLLNQSCKKVNEKQQENKELPFVQHPLEDQFFKVEDSVPAIVKTVVAYLQSRKNKSEIASLIINEVGLPDWSKSFNAANTVNSNRLTRRTTANDTNYIFVPVVVPGTIEVDGALACKVVGDSISVRFLNERKYKKYGFDKNNPRNAAQLTRLMMYLQHKGYGTESFIVTDQRVLSDIFPKPDSSKKEVIKFIAKDNSFSGSGNNLKGNIAASYQVVQLCSITYTNGCPMHPGQVCPDPWTIFPTENCTNYVAWMSDNSGGNDGSGDLVIDFGSNGTVNTSYTGTSGSGASYSSAGYLQELLDIPNTDISYLNNQYELSLEAFGYYLASEDGQLTYLERRDLLVSHLLLLRDDSEYRDYCNSLSAQNADTYGKYYPWFKYSTLQNTNLFLASNIQTLKLNAQKAFYLLNNSLINRQIKQFLVANNYSESAKFRAKSSIEFTLLGLQYESPETLLVDKIDYDAITNPCLRAAIEKIQMPRFANYASNLIRELGSSSIAQIALMPVDGTVTQTYAFTQKLFDAPNGKSYYTMSIDIVNLPKCSQELIAETFFHEFIHVEILSNPNWDNTNSQHQLMIENYMNKLVTSIRNIFPSLPLKDAYAIVYGGFTPEPRLTPEQKSKFLEAQQIALNKIFEIFPSITISELDSIFLDYDHLGTKGNRLSNCN